MNIPITPVSKVFALRLFMTSYKTITSALKLNEPKASSRFAPIINSFLELIQPSSPLLI